MICFQDVNRLYKELPNPVLKYTVPYEKFNHYDFILATDVVSLVYEELFRFLKEYNPDVLF